MQVDWIIRDENDKLLIVALGWGASKEVVENQNYCDGYDVVIICDYKEIDFSFRNTLNKYKSVSLLSWSFGVWASEQLFGGVRFDKAVAVAGTPFMIDKMFGIDPRMWNLTLKVVLNEGVTKFVVRMCGRKLRDYMKHYSLRELKDVQDELALLDVKGRVDYLPSVNWSHFYACKNDLIVPPKSVVNYAKHINVECETIDEVHYVFHDPNFILCAIES